MRVPFTIQSERFASIMHELPDLFARQYDEVVTDKDNQEEDPDYDRYISLENIGMLHCLTVRHNQELIGYFFNVAVPHLHHKGMLMSSSDLVYVLPEYRKGTGIGSALLNAGIEYMKEIGVKKMYVATKNQTRFAKLLKKKRFRLIEEIHSLWIGE